ncbi:MAG: DUF427 domain-containing protein [Gammaproteobacteria bacterium]|nr:DUF427 domain-containing protein [Gammaproteobacteria bacterium]
MSDSYSVSAGTADHPIIISAVEGRIVVRFNGEEIARSERALQMHEARHAAVYYLPRADVRGECLVESDHATHCPYKGRASYYGLRVGEAFSADALWSYEQPIDSMSVITNHVAFYPDRVDSITLEPAGAS